MLGLIISRTAVPMAMLLVIVAVTGYTDLARLSTPDAMACFFSLVGIHSLMAQGRVVFLVAPILPLIRTDFILLSSMLMGYAYVQEQRLFALLFMLIAAGIYFLVTKLNGSYGYLTLFNFSLIGSLTPTRGYRDIPWPGRLSGTLLGIVQQPGLLLSLVHIHRGPLPVLAEAGSTGKAGRVLRPVCVAFYFYRPAPWLYSPSDQYRFFTFSTSLILVWTLGLLTDMHTKLRRTRSVWSENTRSTPGS